jgi:hypothetical protein
LIRSRYCDLCMMHGPVKVHPTLGLVCKARLHPLGPPLAPERNSAPARFCPRCGAPAGEPCHNFTPERKGPGGNLKRPHLER